MYGFYLYGGLDYAYIGNSSSFIAFTSNANAFTMESFFN